MKLPDISLLKGWPTLQPELATAGAPAPAAPRGHRSTPLAGVMQFASNGGGGNDDDDGFEDGYDDDLVYEEPAQQQPTRRAPGAQRGSQAGGSAAGGGGRGGSGGRPRTVQYQPEERYWTEYLRIALPILGLLLMIGLLWFWALQLMDDDNGGNQPVVTEPPVTQEVVVPDSTPTTEATEDVIAPPTPTPTEEVSTPETTPETEETPASTGGEIAIDSVVQTTEEGVNMREDATIAAEAIAQLATGTTLTVTDGPYEADDYVWWQVVNDETGQVGYVVEDFIEVVP